MRLPIVDSEQQARYERLRRQGYYNDPQRLAAVQELIRRGKLIDVSGGTRYEDAQGNPVLPSEFASSNGIGMGTILPDAINAARQSSGLDPSLRGDPNSLFPVARPGSFLPPNRGANLTGFTGSLPAIGPSIPQRGLTANRTGNPANGRPNNGAPPRMNGNRSANGNSGPIPIRSQQAASSQMPPDDPLSLGLSSPDIFSFNNPSIPIYTPSTAVLPRPGMGDVKVAESREGPIIPIGPFGMPVDQYVRWFALNKVPLPNRVGYDEKATVMNKWRQDYPWIGGYPGISDTVPYNPDDEMTAIRNSDPNAPWKLFPMQGRPMSPLMQKAEGFTTTAARQLFPTGAGAVVGGAVTTATAPLFPLNLLLGAGAGILTGIGANKAQDAALAEFNPQGYRDLNKVTEQFRQENPEAATIAELAPGLLLGKPSLNMSRQAWAQRAVGAGMGTGIDIASQMASPGFRENGLDWRHAVLTGGMAGLQTGEPTAAGRFLHGAGEAAGGVVGDRLPPVWDALQFNRALARSPFDVSRESAALGATLNDGSHWANPFGAPEQSALLESLPSLFDSTFNQRRSNTSLATPGNGAHFNGEPSLPGFFQRLREGRPLFGSNVDVPDEPGGFYLGANGAAAQELLQKLNLLRGPDSRFGRHVPPTVGERLAPLIFLSPEQQLLKPSGDAYVFRKSDVDAIHDHLAANNAWAQLWFYSRTPYETYDPLTPDAQIWHDLRRDGVSMQNEGGVGYMYGRENARSLYGKYSGASTKDTATTMLERAKMGGRLALVTLLDPVVSLGERKPGVFFAAENLARAEQNPSLQIALDDAAQKIADALRFKNAKQYTWRQAMMDTLNGASPMNSLTTRLAFWNEYLSKLKYGGPVAEAGGIMPRTWAEYFADYKGVPSRRIVFASIIDPSKPLVSTKQNTFNNALPGMAIGETNHLDALDVAKSILDPTKTPARHRYFLQFKVPGSINPDAGGNAKYRIPVDRDLLERLAVDDDNSRTGKTATEGPSVRDIVSALHSGGVGAVGSGRPGGIAESGSDSVSIDASLGRTPRSDPRGQRGRDTGRDITFPEFYMREPGKGRIISKPDVYNRNLDSELEKSGIEEQSANSALAVTSPTQRSRLFALRQDPRVARIQPVAGFSLTDPQTGERYDYNPSFLVTYRGGRVEYEEVQPGRVPLTAYQQRKAALASAYLQAHSGNRNAFYSIVPPRNSNQGR